MESQKKRGAQRASYDVANVIVSVREIQKEVYGELDEWIWLALERNKLVVCRSETEYDNIPQSNDCPRHPPFGSKWFSIRNILTGKHLDLPVKLP